VADEPLEIPKGKDGTFEVVVFASDGHSKPVSVVLTDDAIASATSLSIQADHPSLADDDVLLFGENIRVQLSAACTYGDTSLAVDATAGPLRSGAIGKKLQVLTSYTIVVEVLTRAGDATPLITWDLTDITIPTQTVVADTGKVQVAYLAADTNTLTPGAYYGVMWRTNSGTARPLWAGTVKVVEAGRL
jgi:hypothetical protein